MSRESTASLSVIPVTQLRRLDPPGDLTDAEARAWQAAVDSKPADWFQEDSAPLLLEYVRAVAQSAELDRVIKAISDGGEGWKNLAKPLGDFMRLRDMESKRVMQAATKLRLTQQSRYTPMASATANKKAGAARPWQGS